MIVHLLLCGVLIGALYFVSKYKRLFRARQCLIISTCALANLQCYPVIASGEEYGRGYDEGYGREYSGMPEIHNTETSTAGFDRELVRSIYVSCYHSQRLSAENYDVPENSIRDYCSCASKHIYGRLTYEDFRLLQKVQSQGVSPPHEIQQKMEFVAKMCRESSIDKMPPSDLEAMDRFSNPITHFRTGK
jgi:hypothetical protein